MALNLEIVKEMAIITAYHDNDWCPDTNIAEVLDQDNKFASIIAGANALLKKAGLDVTVTDQDVATAIWGEDVDLAQEYEEMAG